MTRLLSLRVFIARKSSATLLRFLCAALALTGACSESLDPASLVTRLRAVATVTQVVGDEGRASPMPEEDVQVSVHVATPGARPPIAWRLFVCIPAETRFGLPICAADQPLIDCEPSLAPDNGATGLEGCGDSSMTDDPVIAFQVPDTATLGDTAELLVIGALCGRGEAATFDDILRALDSDEPTLSGCAEADPNEDGNGVDELSTVMFSTVPLQRNGQANRNPELAGVSVVGESELDGWEPAPPDAPMTGCIDSDITSRSASRGFLRMEVELLASSLEDFEDDGETVTEELQISWLSSGNVMDESSGEFENPFSFISERPSDVANVRSSLFYDPREPDDSGTLVRFNFVVRDGRGGTVWAERALCITP